jgi:hypothetical protein
MVHLEAPAHAETGSPATSGSPLVSWIGAHAIGAALLTWIAVVNGYPMLFADSGGYLRVGTEFHYLLDRPVTYGLLIAPLARAFGLWAIVILQAVFASWLVGEVLVAVTKRRSAVMLVMVLAALAGVSSMPWFVGQIMPDLFTPLMALTLYLLVFAPGTGWRIWTMATLLTGQISLHLSHIPIAAGLIIVSGIVLLWRYGWRSAVRGVAPAFIALLVAVTGLCAVNLAVAGSFRPSMESNQFLIARTFDGRIGQPVLDRLCRAERWMLCEARGFVKDPRRALPGQDYLWASDSPRGGLQARNAEAFHAEAGAFARRVLREDPNGTLRMALLGWRDQLIHARAADGMIAYQPQMQVVQQIYRHFPDDRPRFDASRQHRNTLQQLAVVPDRILGLLVVVMTSFILWSAIRGGNFNMIALVIVILATIVGNAAVCGILSGPSDRYQSRVLWLLVLLGSVALAGLVDARARTASPSTRI